MKFGGFPLWLSHLQVEEGGGGVPGITSNTTMSTGKNRLPHPAFPFKEEGSFLRITYMQPPFRCPLMGHIASHAYAPSLAME